MYKKRSRMKDWREELKMKNVKEMWTRKEKKNTNKKVLLPLFLSTC